MNKLCHCGQQLKFHDENSDEPITMDIEETEGSFWWCPSCGIQETEPSPIGPCGERCMAHIKYGCNDCVNKDRI